MMRCFILSTVLLSCVVAFAFREGNSDPVPLDKLCGKTIECPSADDKTPADADYGMRTLHSGMWVGTAVTNSFLSSDFWKLFKYIGGNNADNQKMKMTAPVVEVWELDETRTSVISRSMFFYIPSQFQANPPQPNDSEVFLKQFPEMDLYYRAFGGNNRSKDKYREVFDALQASLDSAGHTIDPAYVFTAGYTRPYWGPQRNEVIFADAATPYN